MKLKCIRSDQFAGIKDIEIGLSDGINLILGENETGKSTLIELIYQTLFKAEKLDGRRDKGFMERYFPTPSAGGVSGDCIDGTLVFEGSGGQYKLSREWAAGGETVSSLIMPDKTRLKAASKIEEVLDRELGYGRGIYNEVVFASQEREYTAIRHLMEDAGAGASGGVSLMGELRSAVANAMLESGGVDVTELEEAIASKIEEYGSNWDDSTFGGEPAGGKAKHGIANPWKKRVGKVLEAYYKKELKNKELKEAASAEELIERAGERYKTAVIEAKEAQRRSESFAKYQGALAKLQYLERSIAEESEALNKLKETLPEWEEAEVELKKLTQQSKKLEKREVRQEDYEKAAELDSSIKSLRRQAGGLELLAGAKLNEGYELEVVSAIDGRKIEAEGDRFEINEAVIIKVPGIIELTLSASDVDIDGINASIQADSAGLDAILKSYKVSTVEELRQAYRESRAQRQELDRRLPGLKAEVALYEKNYKSRKDLGEDITRRGKHIDKLFEELSALPEIPEEYGQIRDIEREEERFKAINDDAQEEVRMAYEALTEAKSALGDKSPEECEEELAAACESFEECRKTYRHWLHIMEVFRELKDRNNTSDTNEIAERFKDYLALLTNDGIRVSEMDDELRQVSLMSRDNYIGYVHLSEGSRDTVSLAFRLAVLEHLFPEGNAVAVFDDPFTDMDEGRRDRACGLIKRFAEKNQVLFVSCSPEYESLLGGNIIRL